MRDPEEPSSARPVERTVRAASVESTERSWRPNTENTINPRLNYGGRRKIRATDHGGNHKQDGEPKPNMGDPEDTLSGVSTNTQDENSTKTDNNQYNS